MVKVKRQIGKIILIVISGLFFVVSLVSFINVYVRDWKPTEDKTESFVATVKSVENLYDKDQMFIVHTEEYGTTVGVATNQVVNLEKLKSLSAGDTINFKTYKIPNFTLSYYNIEIQIAYLEADGEQIVTLESYIDFMSSQLNNTRNATLIMGGICLAVFVLTLVLYIRKRNRMLDAKMEEEERTFKSSANKIENS